MDKRGGKEWSKLHIECDPNIVNMSYVFIPKKTGKKRTKITRVVKWAVGLWVFVLTDNRPSWVQATSFD